MLVPFNPPSIVKEVVPSLTHLLVHTMEVYVIQYPFDPGQVVLVPVGLPLRPCPGHAYVVWVAPVHVDTDLFSALTALFDGFIHLEKKETAKYFNVKKHKRFQ